MSNTASTKTRYVFPRSVMALILREMSTTYGRSPGGYFWAMAEPIGGIVLLTIIFALVSRTPPLGSSFALYYAAGIMMFGTYQTTATKIGQAIRYSKPLLAYPLVSYMDALLARLVLNALTYVMITLILMSGIIVVFDLSLNIDFVTCLRAMLLALVLGFGVGTVNCYLMSMYPIWQSIWSVLTRPMFILSGVIFLIDPLPEGLRTALLYNPVAHPIMLMRRGIYDTYDAVYVSETYVYMIALPLTAIGLLLLRRYHRVMLDEGA